MVKSKHEIRLIEILQVEMEDFRGGNAVQHNLWDVIIIGLLCILCNGETFVDMQIFGETHLDLLRQFLALPHGIPSHDTFGRIFAALDPLALDRCFAHWVDATKDEMAIHHVAIDGKTVRGSGKAGQLAKHIITAFASECQLVIGQRCVSQKNNEITEIPRLLDMFCVKNCTITIDAMGTQKEIAGKIVEKDGDYILALKENHPTLFNDIQYYAEQELFPQDTKLLSDCGAYATTAQKDHGRIEKRRCWLIKDVSWLEQGKDWAGLAGAAVIHTQRTVQTTGEVSESYRYFLYSDGSMTADRFLHLQRSHWRIENNLHWVLDNVFHEDKCQAYIENSAVILSSLRKLALYLTKQETSFKASMRSKRLRCAYDILYALKVLGLDLA